MLSKSIELVLSKLMKMKKKNKNVVQICIHLSDSCQVGCTFIALGCCCCCCYIMLVKKIFDINKSTKVKVLKYKTWDLLNEIMRLNYLWMDFSFILHFIFQLLNEICFSYYFHTSQRKVIIRFWYKRCYGYTEAFICFICN